MRLCGIVWLLGLALASGTARGGTRPYAFSQGTEGLADGELELESWFTAMNPEGANADDLGWDWWLGPVTGITDRVEGGLFAVFVQPPVESGLELSELRLQLTWSPVERLTWPVDVRVRGEVGLPMRFVPEGGSWTFWLTGMVSRDLGALNLTANAGAYLELEKEAEGMEVETHEEPYLVYGVAASWNLAGSLRLGGELFGDFEASDVGRGHWAGPALAYGTGRFWLALSFLFGLTDDTRAGGQHLGRLVLGLTL